MRNFVPCLALLFVTGACTETPDSFPPCVYTAPCPDEDATADADAAPAIEAAASDVVPEGDAMAEAGD